MSVGAINLLAGWPSSPHGQSSLHPRLPLLMPTSWVRWRPAADATHLPSLMHPPHAALPLLPCFVPCQLAICSASESTFKAPFSGSCPLPSSYPLGERELLRSSESAGHTAGSQPAVWRKGSSSSPTAATLPPSLPCYRLRAVHSIFIHTTLPKHCSAVQCSACCASPCSAVQCIAAHVVHHLGAEEGKGVEVGEGVDGRRRALQTHAVQKQPGRRGGRGRRKGSCQGEREVADVGGLVQSQNVRVYPWRIAMGND